MPRSVISARNWSLKLACTVTSRSPVDEALFERWVLPNTAQHPNPYTVTGCRARVGRMGHEVRAGGLTQFVLKPTVFCYHRCPYCDRSGNELPSETTLMEPHKTSRNAFRSALGLLIKEEPVTSHLGRATSFGRARAYAMTCNGRPCGATGRSRLARPGWHRPAGHRDGEVHGPFTTATKRRRLRSGRGKRGA